MSGLVGQVDLSWGWDQGFGFKDSGSGIKVRVLGFLQIWHASFPVWQMILDWHLKIPEHVGRRVESYVSLL